MSIPYKIIFNDNSTEPFLRKEFKIDFKLFEKVWVCQKKRNKYVVIHGRISSVWATNIVGVCVESATFGTISFDKNNFNMIHKSKQEAIDWCVKQNQRLNVKVYDND